MKKKLFLALTGFIALLFASVLAISGCAPQTSATPGATSNGATVFFPNISI